ncbi:hypothetical protein [Burkholderia cepacia]|uniref:hypothetical protein n=1 Tax=Burkholderia cepacia TaxID=292 RepID=UPI0012D3C941|nr:hypothetical protein [Burkholderia cepacia]
MSFLQNRELVDGLTSLPERQLVEVIALALEAREAKVRRPEWESAKFVLAGAHRFNETSAVPSPWTLLVLARPQYSGEFVDEGQGPSKRERAAASRSSATPNASFVPFVADRLQQPK